MSGEHDGRARVENVDRDGCGFEMNKVPAEEMGLDAQRAGVRAITDHDEAQDRLNHLDEGAGHIVLICDAGASCFALGDGLEPAAFAVENAFAQRSHEFAGDGLHQNLDRAVATEAEAGVE